MGKKIEPAEPKKECPSCGLGVALDSTICEFCGWDFNEEDEWILQIEKLERDLILEKQKFEPGTVNQRIESTLRNPAQERVEAAKAAERSAPIQPKAEPKPASVSPPSARSRELKQAPSPPPTARPAQTRLQPVASAAPQVVKRKLAAAVSPAPPPAQRPAPAYAGPEGPRHDVRKVRTVKPAEPSPAVSQAPAGPKKTRVLRKVKQR
jgi:hypothetical protein